MKKTPNGNGRPAKAAALESDEDVMTLKKHQQKLKQKVTERRTGKVVA
jgi:hypothetical protein